MKERERRARLVQWIEIIYEDVEDLLLDDHIFWELQGVVQENPRFAECSGLFLQWTASAFVQATAVGVRRQAKADEDSVSLRRFLNEVEEYPSLVSREHYMGLYAGKKAWLIKVGQEDFDRLAGEGGAHIPVVVVKDHISQLTQAVGGIEHYVDRRVAHYDKRSVRQPTPTFADLSEALKTLERIVIFYWQFLKGHGMVTMLPDIQFDWKEILRFPWSPSPHDVSEAI